ncbi:hypothetical protein CDL12_30353 [Handroanthus impetiginosus]|uniref:non-specific serine/threonine protein kinase n=1 Tax=Handroanthus impetiginosus TaxID=429701 RepID=A0A2G9FWW5_9LAMI|nr:hypothetical protein CDL12_30353 [Handroanthus impetiginosus]
MKMNDNMELTSWMSPSDPGPGNYTFHRDQGAYSIQKRSTLYWKSGQLGRLGYSEIPYVITQILSGQPLVNRNSLSFPNYSRPSYYNNTRLLMNSSGEIQYYDHSLADGGRSSLLLWKEPQDPCSVYDVCGKFSICDMNNGARCECLNGFKPASLGGCERESICSQDDGFLNLNLRKIGGQVTSFDQAQEERTCKEECLNNCECEAYVYQGANASNRETGNSVAKCYIWRDLENLQIGHTDDGLNLSLRVPFSYRAKSASRICQPCLNKSVPYPLSIQPN